MRSVADIGKAVRDALAAHGVQVPALSSLPSHPCVLTDFATVVVKLCPSIDEALDGIYWMRILGDGGVPVAPVILDEPVSIDGSFGVVTRYLAPDRETDERDAVEAAKVMRRVHDIAFEYLERDGTAWTPHDSQPRNFVQHRGTLHLVDLNNVERRDRASARLGAAADFSNALRADVREHAHERFLAAYDS